MRVSPLTSHGQKPHPHPRTSAKASIPPADQPGIFRVNTGTVAFVPFTANSVEEACQYVRRHQNPDYAAARWLQIRENGVYVWVT
jgi:hypothetical protein